jgi:hypothetical protein
MKNALRMKMKALKYRIIMISLLWGTYNLAISQDIKVIFDEEETSISPVKLDSLIPTGFLTTKDTLRNSIIENARKYLGVSYKYGQSDENGFDCSGFVKYVYGNFGYSLPHSSYEQFHITERLDEKKARPGDLVFFITRGQRISHVGIYIGDNTFIHSPSRGKSVCIDSLDSEYYRKHLVGFGAVLK